MEIQLWRELLDPYQLAVDELTVKFHHIIEEHRNQGLYSPIESVDGRVKSIVSILDKMQRKNVSMNDIEKKIEDLAGIRIICQFVEKAFFKPALGKEQQGTGKEELYDKKTWLFTHE